MRAYPIFLAIGAVAWAVNALIAAQQGNLPMTVVAAVLTAYLATRAVYLSNKKPETKENE